MNLNIPCSKILRSYLITEGVIGAHDAASWPSTYGKLPKSPVLSVALRDGPVAQKRGRNMRTKETVIGYPVEVYLRHNAYGKGSVKALEIANALDQVKRNAISFTSTGTTSTNKEDHWYDHAVFGDGNYIDYGVNFDWNNAWEVSFEIKVDDVDITHWVMCNADSTACCITIKNQSVHVKINGTDFECTTNLGESVWNTISVSYTGGQTGTITVVTNGTTETFINDAGTTPPDSTLVVGANNSKDSFLYGVLRKLLISNNSAHYLDAPYNGTFKDQNGSNDAMENGVIFAANYLIHCVNQVNPIVPLGPEAETDFEIFKMNLLVTCTKE